MEILFGSVAAVAPGVALGVGSAAIAWVVLNTSADVTSAESENILKALVFIRTPL
jgi:hypothetical protein